MSITNNVIKFGHKENLIIELNKLNYYRELCNEVLKKKLNKKEEKKDKNKENTKMQNVTDIKS